MFSRALPAPGFTHDAPDVKGAAVPWRTTALPYPEPADPALQRPPRPVGRRDPLLRELDVTDVAAAVDLEGLPRAHREASEEDHLGQRTGMAGKIGKCRRTALAGIDPFEIDTLRALVLLRRRIGLEILVPLRIEERRVFRVHAGDDHPVVSHPELAADVGRGPLGSLGEVERAGRAEVAIPPVDPNRRTRALRGKVILDAGRLRRRLDVKRGGLGDDPLGIPEIEDPE